MIHTLLFSDDFKLPGFLSFTLNSRKGLIKEFYRRNEHIRILRDAETEIKRKNIHKPDFWQSNGVFTCFDNCFVFRGCKYKYFR